MTRALGPKMRCVSLLPPVRAGEPIALFDGKDTAERYTYLRNHGKGNDPNGNVPVCGRGGRLISFGKEPALFGAVG
jgi:hypothetical protein